VSDWRYVADFQHNWQGFLASFIYLFYSIRASRYGLLVLPIISVMASGFRSKYYLFPDVSCLLPLFVQRVNDLAVATALKLSLALLQFNKSYPQYCADLGICNNNNLGYNSQIVQSGLMAVQLRDALQAESYSLFSCRYKHRYFYIVYQIGRVYIQNITIQYYYSSI
jgi:hypothetical protein